MLGGGTFTSQNKIIPGAYVNYASVERASVQLGDRGVGALPIVLNWGKDKGVFEVVGEDLQDEAMKVFGYSYEADEMLPIREIFRHAVSCYFYKLNSGVKASSDISTAKYSGTRGNEIKHVVTVNVDDTDKFDVITYVGATKVDAQTVEAATDLVSNDYVDFKSDATLSASAGISLSGGTNGEVTGTEHQAALKALEPYSFNALGCMSVESTVQALYGAYCKRMRDDVGAKFSLITKGLAHDYIGTLNIKNKVSDTAAPDYALVPWVLGAECGCAVNKTCENMTYDGEYSIIAEYTQTELKNAILAGEFVFHKVGTEVCVLSDINTYVSTTNEMNEDFQLNQVIRVIDQIAVDTATQFKTRFLGKVQNDADGRISFWGVCVDIHNQLQDIRAIEEFSDTDIEVSKGTGKRDVVETEAVKPVCAMSKLYMTIKVA